MSPLGSTSRSHRVTMACDRCHRSNTKCADGPDPSTCRPCFDFGDLCTYDRPVKRRGPRSGRPRRTSIPPANILRAWHSDPPAPHEVIVELTEGYRSIVYPIFPIFHWPAFQRDVQNMRYTFDRAFKVVTMLVCAIVSARLRDGAALPVATPSTLPAPSSEAFYLAAVADFPSDLTECKDWNYKRAKALMAILCVQYSDITKLHTHLGDYGTLSFNDGYYDESRWPAMGEIEREERRRLFWSMYTLEIFAAITWGGLVRHRQSQCNVRYPAEVWDDFSITDDCLVPPDNPERLSFLHGWNKTTDLYRILELLVDHIRARKFQSTERPDLRSLMYLPRLHTAEIHHAIDGIFANLPPVFKIAAVMTGNVEVDCFSFQAANINVTYQTVKMVLASAEESNVEARCRIAGTLLDALATIPTAYLAAISAPMLYHLASVGHLLAVVIQSPLTQWSFLQVRNVLLAMANLLCGLETVLSISPDISSKLKAHVEVIDERMESAAMEAKDSQIFHQALPQVDHPISLPPASHDNLIGGEHDAIDWNFLISPSHQVQLQSDLTGWPFDFGVPDFSDLLGE